MARFTQNPGGTGSALNYVQVAGTPVSVTGYPTVVASLTISTTGKPVQISVTGDAANSQAGTWVKLNLFRDEQPIGNPIQIEASAVSENVPYAINFIDDVEAGDHLYEAIVTQMSVGTWVFGEVSGPVINAVELTGFKGDRGPQGFQGIQGEQGEPGSGGMVYLGNYVSGNGYVVDLAVVRGSDNNLYIAKSSGELGDPVGNTAEWDIFSDNTAGSADLVVPTAIKDQNDADFITFTRTGTGTARIATPQDDLSLRSARDITLYAGDDGPGNVYIGWGDAVYTPDSPNRVATMGDLESGVKTWTAQNSSVYEIRQAHGGAEVELTQPISSGDVVSSVGNFVNGITILVDVPEILSQDFNNVYSGAQYFRRLTLDINGQSRAFQINSAGSLPNQWYLDSLSGPVTIYSGTGMYANIEYGGAPVVWWDADSLNLVTEGDLWKFRGAKIEYHSYSVDAGTTIGTIYIADDSGDNNVTHIETSSGANDNGNVILWKRSGGEQQLYAYRADNESDTVKIHWTAQVYYGTEYYD